MQVGIDLFVPVPDCERLLELPVGVAVEHLTDASQYQLAHALDTEHQIGGMQLFRERQDPLADVLGKVANPFQIIGDPHGADDLPQIDRHRLAARNREHAFFLDLVLQRVDARIERDGALREVHIAVCECIERIGDLLLDQMAHLGNHAGELPQIDVERLGRVVRHGETVLGWLCRHPKRPVM